MRVSQCADYTNWAFYLFADRWTDDMYEDYWGLSASPFRNDADEQWFCQTPGHDEALARLFFLVEQERRCGLLAGTAGTGKSLLLRVLFDELKRSQRQAALVNTAALDGHQLLAELCDDLRLPTDESSTSIAKWRVLRDQLAAWQLAGVQTVLLFDRFERAQPDCVRTIEHLLHLDDCAGCGHTVIVAGRSTSSALGELADLADLWIDVAPLDRAQTLDYVAELLNLAGSERELFEPAALAAIYERSRGVPRAINRLCDLSLLAAMSESLPVVDESTIVRAAQELQPDTVSVRTTPLNR